MLHLGILPNHRAWGDFFANLAVVVIDEAHVYRGVFGSHVANVLRRLRRICELYGTAPRFLLASARRSPTRASWPTRLTGLDDVHGDRRATARPGTQAHDRDVEPAGHRRGDAGARRSALAEAADLLAELVIEGARTIVFMKSRKAVELMARFAAARARAAAASRELAERIAPYRAGYTPQQRRELERAAASTASCSASSPPTRWSSGIDIGALDAAICVTFPGTVASLRQMWGRAGRRGRGLAVYVAGEDALDQFFCRHPDEFLERPVEAAILDHENEQLYAAHLLCAAHEGPLEPADDASASGRAGATAAERARRRRRPARAPGRHVRPAPRRGVPGGRRLAAQRRAATASRSSTPASGEVIGNVDAGPAPSTVHQGAIYLHGGRQFEVDGARLDDRRALVRPFDGNWYTQPKRETDTHIERVLERRDGAGRAAVASAPSW